MKKLSSWLAEWEVTRCGITLVSHITVLSAKPIHRGIRELNDGLDGRPMSGMRKEKRKGLPDTKMN